MSKTPGQILYACMKDRKPAMNSPEWENLKAGDKNDLEHVANDLLERLGINDAQDMVMDAFMNPDIDWNPKEHHDE